MTQPAVTARSTLGVPFIPPAVISEQSNRLRGMLGRWHRRMAPPPVRILEAALSLLNHRVLVALCQAGVPDALDKPTPVTELAVAMGADPARLDRLVRYAAAQGWLDVDGKGRVRANATTRFLRADHPAGWRSWVDFMAGEHVVGAIGALSLHGAGHGFESVNGEPIFDWFEGHPKEWATFDAAMAAGARMHALMLDKAINWHATTTICDVGGGTGELARSLLDRHPDWHGTVVDLPAVLSRAGTHPRLSLIAGDAFVSVPAGYDMYLLVNVLHDWPDPDAVRLLGAVAAVCEPASRVIVVDSVAHAKPRDDLFLRADVLMAALTDGGRERTTEEFRDLGEQAGLHLDKRTNLGSGDAAFEFRPTPTPPV